MSNAPIPPRIALFGETIVADGDGYVMCRKFRAATEQGEVVMVIAAEVDYANQSR